MNPFRKTVAAISMLTILASFAPWDRARAELPAKQASRVRVTFRETGDFSAFDLVRGDFSFMRVSLERAGQKLLFPEVIESSVDPAFADQVRESLAVSRDDGALSVEVAVPTGVYKLRILRKSARFADDLVSGESYLFAVWDKPESSNVTAVENDALRIEVSVLP